MQALADDVVGRAANDIAAASYNQRIGLVDDVVVLAGVGKGVQEVLDAVQPSPLLVV